LYSSTDLHISATASRLIGECQAQALLSSRAFNELARRDRRHRGETAD